MSKMNRREVLRALVSTAPALWAGRFASLQAQGAAVQLQTIAPKLSLLTGAGGNIAILEAPDGLFMVDSGLPNTAEAVDTKARSAGAVPLKMLFNTHFHYDHVGGNERIGGEGVEIMAQENVLKRVSTPQMNKFFGREFPALAPQGRPKKTFSANGTLKWGGETIRYQYQPPAHTDGDSTLHFQNANVYHCGDLYFNGMYPFIDYSAGGSIEGMAADAERIAKAVDSHTKVIPGHGPLGTRQDVQAFRDMLADINEKMSAAIKSGKTLEQIQAAEPTKAYDAKWGTGFLKPADFVKLIYMGSTGKAT